MDDDGSFMAWHDCDIVDDGGGAEEGGCGQRRLIGGYKVEMTSTEWWLAQWYLKRATLRVVVEQWESGCGGAPVGSLSRRRSPEVLCVMSAHKKAREG